MNGRASKWMKMGLVNTLLLISIGTGVCGMYQPAAAKGTSFEAQAEQATTIDDPQLNSAGDPKLGELVKNTVQIKMYAPLPTAQPGAEQHEKKTRSYLLTRGLGSLVVWQGREVIVTHNHWGDALDKAENVQIYDGNGKLLRRLRRDKFISMILYSDPGTLVLHDPTGTWLSASSQVEEQSVAIGDIVTIAQQDPVNLDHVDLLQAEVVSQRQDADTPILQVAVVDNGTINPGDSGGGVWTDGEFVGNTWAIVTNGEQADSPEDGLVALLPSVSFQSQNDVVDIPASPALNSMDVYMR